MAVAMIGPKFYAWDRNGKPLAFGKLYTYQARTNVPKPTYQSEDQVVENTNPVILNGEGYANVYLDGSYKMVLKDDKDNEIWSSDPVTSNQVEEWINCFSANYVSPTSFKISGNQTDEYRSERKVRIDNNTLEYAYADVLSSTYASGETSVVINKPVVTTGILTTCTSIVSSESSFNDQDLGGLTNYQAASVADMIAGDTLEGHVDLALGQMWAIDDYYGGASPNNSGVLFFKVVEAGTGTADGGKYIDIDATMQLEQILKTPYDALAWGAMGDGVTPDHIAIQSAINYAQLNEGEVFLTPRNYYITESLVISEEINFKSARPFRSELGCRINHENPDPTQNAIQYSVDKVLYDCEFSGVYVRSQNGHAINIPYGAVRCKFLNLRLTVASPDKSVINANYLGTYGTDFIGVYSCLFEGGEYIVNIDPSRSTPIVKFKTNYTALNENKFSNLWISNANGFQAISISCSNPTQYVTNNVIENVTFEVCSGGAVYLQATAGTHIKNCTYWDTPDGYKRNIIQISSNSDVYANTGLTIENCQRIGSSLNGAVNDIYLGNSTGTTIIGSISVSASSRIDFNSRSCTMIASDASERLNDVDVSFYKSRSTESKEYLTKSGNKITDSGDNLNVTTVDGDIKLVSSVSGNGNTLTVSGNTFFGGYGAVYPGGDALIGLGLTTNRWSVVYAASGTINTSDEREKTDIEAISSAERAVALEIKSIIGRFKFLDAVDKKGEHARYHFGVGAQAVKSIFEKHGLDGFSYGVLCYDEWDDKPEVVDSSGEVIEQRVSAGNRYGIRYSELLMMILAAT